VEQKGGAGGVRRPAALLALCALALAVAGCGQRKTSLSTGTPQPLRVAVVFPNAAEASIYAAKGSSTGFRQSGLKVTLLQDGFGTAAIRDLSAGRADLAVASAPDLLEARSRGLRVVAVGALVQRPLTAVISLSRESSGGHSRRGRGRGGLRALATTTVGTMDFDYQRAFAATAVSGAKVQVVGSDVEAPLTAGKVGAIIAYSNYQGIDLALRHKAPRVVPIDRRGVPSYPELLLVANPEGLSRNGNLIRRFVGALARSTKGLRRSEPGQLAGWLSPGPAIPRPLQLQALRSTLPLTVPPRGRPFGWIDGASVARLDAWMRTKGLVRRAAAGSAFTNTYLPGEGLQR
jgi:ABC-type nitrate/sulfonate/bicarbonate transport system substrate-binding protein